MRGSALIAQKSVDEAQAEHSGEQEAAGAEPARRSGGVMEEGRADEEAGESDTDGEGIARAGELPHEAFHVLQVELNLEFAAFDGFERPAQDIGQECDDAVEIVTGAGGLSEEAARGVARAGELFQVRPNDT